MDCHVSKFSAIIMARKTIISYDTYFWCLFALASMFISVFVESLSSKKNIYLEEHQLIHGKGFISLAISEILRFQI
jgi:hypothetical protein